MIKTAKTINYLVCIFWLAVSVFFMITNQPIEDAMLRCAYSGICYFLIKDLDIK
jgi:hypothetical protein